MFLGELPFSFSSYLLFIFFCKQMYIPECVVYWESGRGGLGGCGGCG